MATIKQNYTEALKEFETLTNKRAATLKNKGKEAGLKKLTVLLKSGKTLDQRLDDLDKVTLACEKAKAADAAKLAKMHEVATVKLTDGLKKNIAEFTTQAKLLGPDDADLKLGFEVLLKRLGQVGKRVKMEGEQRRVGMQALAGKTMAPDDKVKSDLKVTYLGLKKGCEETEALMKVFISRPTEANLLAAFSSPTGPRSIGVSVTGWKAIVKKQPALADQMAVNPEHLLVKIADLTQRKNRDFWNAQLQLDAPGWEDRAKKVATMCLDQVKHWQRVADDIKKLAA